MVIVNFEMIVNSRAMTSPKIASAKLNTMTIGEKIRMLRKDRGWSQIELAEKLAVKPQNISRYEKGHVQPRESTLALFAEVFEVPVSELSSPTQDFPNLDPETAEYVRAIPTLNPKDQEAVKCVLKALVTAKRAQSLFAS
jgi:transcriptional regulator with XRE-family HTH domain